MKFKIIMLLLMLCSRSALADIEMESVVSGLNSPVAITNAGDGSGRLFVTQQNGIVLIHKNDAVLATPFLDIGASGADRTARSNEQGLLSIAFHPDYSSNGFFFVDYTRKSDGATVVARYSVSAGDPDIADPNSELILLTIAQPYANHNGGQLQFGKDHYLYIGMGDGGSAGDPENRAQNPQSLLGKMLRIDVDHGNPYAIPADNPFVADSSVLPEIWAIGYRNPWRFSFDRLTGDMWVADVGQDNWEEVDHEAAGDGGRNYGWRLMEANHCYIPYKNCNKTKLTLPIIEYAHGFNPDNTRHRCSITGGYLYRGTDLPALYGMYLYADFCSGEIWGARQNEKTGQWSSVLLTRTTTHDMITSFGEDESGEIYVATIFESGDKVSKLVNAAPSLALYMDDFEDNDVSDWSFDKGRWQTATGKLANTTKKIARGFAPYAGCTQCKIETEVTITNKNAVISLLAWHTDNKNFVEVQLNASTNRLLLRQVVNGKVVAKTKLPYVIDAGQSYDISLRYGNGQFLLWLDNKPTVSLATTTPPSGNIGLQVKNGTSQFEFIRASE